MRTTILRASVHALACATVLLSAADAWAFRMIHNSGTGRVTFGSGVDCNSTLGFAHWTTTGIAWRLNPASQGSKSGMLQAFQGAMANWNSVTPAGYVLSYGGTTPAGFATDGVNTIHWGTGNGCSGGCLALTALVLASGQVITESDILMNDLHPWNANGTDYDAQSILAHELGHSLGIHHSEIKSKRDRPTMYASYIGTDGRSLSADDRGALNCVFARYPPPGSAFHAAELAAGDGAAEEPGLRLAHRSREDGVNLRFALAGDEGVTLEVFNVAGRRVATLVQGGRAAGEHEVAWDGMTASGPAPRGVYFARLRTSQGQASTTVYLSR